jgi:hypothetical protein
MKRKDRDCEKQRKRKLGLKDVPLPRDAWSAMEAAPLAPVFFVSVAFKGFSPAVSLLFATLAGNLISVAVKGVTLRSSEQVGGVEQDVGIGRRENLRGPRASMAGKGGRKTVPT